MDGFVCKFNTKCSWLIWNQGALNPSTFENPKRIMELLLKLFGRGDKDKRGKKEEREFGNTLRAAGLRAIGDLVIMMGARKNETELETSINRE